jgi:hypothetical protein
MIVIAAPLGTETRPGMWARNIVVYGALSFAAVSAGLMAGCGPAERVSRNIGTGETFPISGMEGRWAGRVTPADNSCGPTTTGSMSIGSGAFGFDPFQSTTIIQGQISGRELHGSLSRLGANRTMLSIRFDGIAESGTGKDRISGTLVSGPCRWSVTLDRR